MDKSNNRKKRPAPQGLEANLLLGQSDPQLVAASKNGDGQAFEILFQRHKKRVFSVALGMVRNHEDAEDIVQQSFMKAFVHLEAFAGQSAFLTWLTRIAINEALMSLRKFRSHQAASFHDVRSEEGLELSHEIADPTAGIEERYAALERARLVSFTANNLPRGMRQAVQLALEDQTTAETAEIMRLPQSTVKARLFQARRKLRPLLSRLLQPVRRTAIVNNSVRAA